ncbi:SpaH/EbpB family LPXTG-anchored major pilin [Ohessyouella blattaphilus]|uniref:SpaH/EbpB family LPXTG-anchored major pilin n=1 Tax=Ohessyouella blattaphilus TaxID=2949333 RepID=A0ABT1EKN9_9FIRM|nr:SpaH/EbpB family LPXTG-anchored major pilin [Ohessyouella blattaphilus]MCP1111270.1 SpaH/EbpB family LPXTG-anchored major pilin [Ohessyouella blattaphilus]MCR8564664.1 SpaH/EbpB family LPXTG-anchored major pilin [Ohessyouella blattaphilus]MDL2249711.1 SpaH/EbpB family LPXTG-anchored major pilin [Lachnospiraceae bacterium OttesenSCG-928-J05]
MTKKFINKLLSAFLALSLLFASSAVALAAPADVPNPALEGSITVHKYGTDHEPTNPANGLEITDETTLSKLGTPLSGVGFTLSLIKETDDDWTFKEGMSAAEALMHIETTYPEQTTDEHGITSWDGLDSVRYYVLEETTAPANGNYRAMEPTIIAVPYGFTGSGTGWNYDVHVYPKNVNQEEVTKTVTDNENGYKVGDTVTWVINGRVPSDLRLPNGTEEGTHIYGSLSFHDQLDTRLDYTQNSETVNMILPGDEKILLEREDDYTVEEEAPHGIKIALTEAGIDKLVDTGAGRIEIILPTVINSSATVTTNEEGDLAIENNVTKSWQHAGTQEDNSATPTDKPKVTLAYIEILKVDHKQKDILLNGAQFKVATSEANAKAGNFIKDGDGEEILVTTAAGGGNVAGYAVISGLPASADSDVSYYLREVKAPEAPEDHPDWEYVLRPDAIKVTIPAGQNNASVTVENTRLGDDGPGPIFGLPLTGGIGAAIFIAAGLLLVMIGLFALKKSKRIEKK